MKTSDDFGCSAFSLLYGFFIILSLTLSPFPFSLSFSSSFRLAKSNSDILSLYQYTKSRLGNCLRPRYDCSLFVFVFSLFGSAQTPFFHLYVYVCALFFFLLHRDLFVMRVPNLLLFILTIPSVFLVLFLCNFLYICISICNFSCVGCRWLNLSILFFCQCIIQSFAFNI